jgi:hypothetical protein
MRAQTRRARFSSQSAAANDVSRARPRSRPIPRARHPPASRRTSTGGPRDPARCTAMASSAAANASRAGRCVRRLPPGISLGQVARSRRWALRRPLPPHTGRGRDLRGRSEDGRPLRLIIRTDQPARQGRPAIRSTTIVRFSVYETLPATAANRSHLALLPHPGAGPGQRAGQQVLRGAAYRCATHRSAGASCGRWRGTWRASTST